MKKLLLAVLTIVLIIAMAGCAGKELMNDPVADLYQYANQLESDGALAVVGYGESSRKDLAMEKSIANAQRMIGEALNVEVNALKKKFIEEVGTDDAEVNEFFSIVTTILTKSEYSGATMEKTYNLERKDGKLEYYTVMALNPDLIVQSIDDQLKNRKMYERFRASNAFKELEDKIEKYEESQKVSE